jgi:hypothetical protein
MNNLLDTFLRPGSRTPVLWIDERSMTIICCFVSHKTIRTWKRDFCDALVKIVQKSAENGRSYHVEGAIRVYCEAVSLEKMLLVPSRYNDFPDALKMSLEAIPYLGVWSSRLRKLLCSLNYQFPDAETVARRVREVVGVFEQRHLEFRRTTRRMSRIQKKRRLWLPHAPFETVSKIRHFLTRVQGTRYATYVMAFTYASLLQDELDSFRQEESAYFVSMGGLVCNCLRLPCDVRRNISSMAACLSRTPS